MPLPENPTPEQQAVINEFSGRSVVLIGAPPRGYNSARLAEVMKPLGTEVKTTFTKKTDLAFHNPSVGGDKLKKVQKAGIQIITYDDALKTLGAVGVIEMPKEQTPLTPANEKMFYQIEAVVESIRKMAEQIGFKNYNFRTENFKYKVAIPDQKKPVEVKYGVPGDPDRKFWDEFTVGKHKPKYVGLDFPPRQHIPAQFRQFVIDVVWEGKAVVKNPNNPVYQIGESDFVGQARMDLHINSWERILKVLSSQAPVPKLSEWEKGEAIVAPF